MFPAVPGLSRRVGLEAARAGSGFLQIAAGATLDVKARDGYTRVWDIVPLLACETYSRIVVS